MENSGIKLIIYDCDGVLFDSKEANKAFYNHILSRFCLPEITEEQLEYVQISTCCEAIDYLFASSPHRSNAMEYLKVIDNTPFIALLRLEPGISEVLRYLKRMYKLAIATNRGKSMATLLNRFDLEGLFDIVITSMDVERPKPHPEALFKILGHFNVNPGEALFIGDSRFDFMVSHHVKVPFVSYKNPALNASYYIYDHRDILKVLDQYKGKNGII